MDKASRQFAKKLHLVQLGSFRPLVGPNSMIGSIRIVDLIETHKYGLKSC